MGLLWFFLSLIAYVALGFVCCLVAPKLIKWYFEDTVGIESDDYYFIAIFWPMWIVCAIFAIPFEIAVRYAKRFNEKMNKK